MQVNKRKQCRAAPIRSAAQARQGQLPASDKTTRTPFLRPSPTEMAGPIFKIQLAYAY